MGCEKDSVVDQHGSNANKEWAAHCLSVNCPLYPAGYRTVETKEGNFYFRLNKNRVLGYSTRTYGSRELEQFGESGELIRQVVLADESPSLKIFPCCRQFLDAQTLEMNVKSGYRNPNNLDITFDVSSYSWLSGVRIGDTQINTFNGLEALELAHFDEAFWILKDNGLIENSAGADWDIVLVSKTHILFGRHIEVKCAFFCKFRSIVFEDDSSTAGLIVEGSNMRWREQRTGCYDSGSCRALLNPTKSREPYATIPGEMQRIEQIIENLQMRPQDRLETD